MASGRLLFAGVLSTVMLASCGKGAGTRGTGGSIGTGGSASTGGSIGTGGSVAIGSSGGTTGGSAGQAGAGGGGSTSSDPADAGALGSAGASGAAVGTGGAPGTPSDAGPGSPIVPAFAAAARGFAAEYVAWGRVDDELRWAPFLCRIPLPGMAYQSQSNDPATHGQKLYSVFAKNHDSYPGGPQTDQVVVKQSWIAERVTDYDGGYPPDPQAYPRDAADHFYGYALGDGGLYRAADLAGLYIMFKLPETTPDTDEGWVYATITAAGEVTAAGRVESCMACHEVATHERLFGVPLMPSLKLP